MAATNIATPIALPSNNLWELIIAVHPSITDIELGRQSRLLNIVLVTFAALFVIMAIRSFYYTFIVPDNNAAVLIAAVAEIALSIPICVLNRSGRYSSSARLFLSMATVLVIGFASVDGTGPYWAVLVVLLSAIFVSFAATIVTTIVMTVATVLIALHYVDLTYFRLEALVRQTDVSR